MGIDKTIFQLCDSINEADALQLDNEQYQANFKFDGERLISVVIDGDCIMMNRNGKICNFHFREVEAELKLLPNCIIDGEIISLDDDFTRLQSRALTQNLTKLKALQETTPVKYMVFDILKSGNDDIRGKPLKERVAELDKVVTNSQHIEKVAYKPIAELLGISKQGGIGKEGIIVKNMNSPYLSSRNEGWRKLKLWKETIIAFQKYTPNNKGIRVETDDGLVACQVAGSQAKEIQNIIDTQGSVKIFIQYLTKSDDGHLRFPSCRGIAE